MSIAKRTFGTAPSLRDSMAAGKEFTDTALSLDLNEVLTEAKYRRNIGHAAAHLSGVRLQHEGDGTSKRFIFAAYDAVYDLMAPSLHQYGADATRELFATPTTRTTLLDLSTRLSSYGLSSVAYQYRSRRDFLRMTDEGLALDSTQGTLPDRFKTERGGCPYAKSQNAPYFNRFTDRIVETYTYAHYNEMPEGWLDATRRLLQRR